MSKVDETATPTPEAVTREMSRIRGIIEYRGDEDHEDLISYAKEVVRLRSRRATPSEGGDGALREALEALVEAMRNILRCEYDGHGLKDCVDNNGQAYTSQYLADQIEKAENAMSAALALPAAAGWQDIGTAPKISGREIMAARFGLHPDGVSTMCIRDPFVSFWSPTLGKFYCDPTHWLCEFPRSLPALPPTSKTGGDPASTGAGDD